MGESEKPHFAMAMSSRDYRMGVAQSVCSTSSDSEVSGEDSGLGLLDLDGTGRAPSLRSIFQTEAFDDHGDDRGAIARGCHSMGL